MEASYGFKPEFLCNSTSPFKIFKWVDSGPGHTPNAALWAGEDIDGHAIYVGRAEYNGDWIPAKVIPGKNAAYICYAGKEISVHNFQILCERRLEWVSCFGSNVPSNAVPGCRTHDGEELFIGRVRHENSLTVGKVHPSHGVCYIPFDGQEIPYDSYEILTITD